MRRRKSKNRQITRSTKVSYKNHTFASKLELYMYKSLEKAKIKVLYEGKTYSLVDGFSFKNASYETTNVYGFGHPPYYANMIKALRGLTDPICSGEEGLKSLELLIASYRSSQSGERISLPLKR